MPRRGGVPKRSVLPDPIYGSIRITSYNVCYTKLLREMVRVYIAQRRKISVGDKMAGRHGNKA